MANELDEMTGPINAAGRDDGQRHGEGAAAQAGNILNTCNSFHYNSPLEKNRGISHLLL